MVVSVFQVSWVLAANDVRAISKLLRSRLCVVQVERSSPEAFDALLEGVLRDLADGLAIPRSALPDLAPEACDMLRRAFLTGASIRKVKHAIETIVARTVAAPPRRH